MCFICQFHSVDPSFIQLCIWQTIVISAFLFFNFKKVRDIKLLVNRFESSKASFALIESCLRFYIGTAIQQMPNPFSPHLFLISTSAFKLYQSFSCFYPKVYSFLIAVFFVPSGPCWYVTVYSRYYTCDHRIATQWRKRY